MAPQVPRIALVFGLVGIAYFVARSQIVPPSFGEKGFYRADFTQELAKKEMHFAGSQACMDCHSDKYETTNHVTNGVSCQSCHGPALAHTEDYEKSKPLVPHEREDCGRCHQSVAGRRANFPQQDLAEHNPGTMCTACHTVHEAATEEEEAEE